MVFCDDKLEIMASAADTSDDLTVMAIFMRNSHQIPTKIELFTQSVLFIISIMLTIVGVSTAMRFTIFHKNQRNIFISLLVVWVELLMCRLLVWTFKYRLVALGDNPKLHDECYHFSRCTLSQNGFDPIFIAANLRYHYMYFVITTPIGILVERIFATIFVKDYEKKSRYWIFVLIFVAQNLTAVPMAIVTTTGQLSFAILISTVCVTLLFAGMIYTMVEFFNSQRLLILEQDHRQAKYSLSIRYQLKENLKTLKLMRRFFLSIIAIIIMMGLSNSMPVLLGWPKNAILVTRQYLDYIFNSNPIILVPTAMLTIENYRKYMFNKARRTLGLRLESQKVNIRKLRPQMHMPEADVYFEIFEKQLETDGKLRSSMRRPRVLT